MRPVLLVALVSACGTTNAPAPSSVCDARDAIIAVSDYTSSAVGAVAVDGGGGDQLATGALLGKDPALAVSRGRAFYLAREQGQVLELDPRCGRPTAQYAVNDPAHSGSSNPQDVAAAPDGTLWVPRFNVPSIALVKDGKLDGAIDLSSFDDDGNPQASAIAIVDVGGAPHAFVALERLDQPNLLSTRASWMLEIDVATRAVIGTTPLAGRNPFGTIDLDGSALWLAEPGNFDVLDEAAAGIERFEATTRTTRLVVAEHDLGASVVEVAVSGGCGAAILADARKGINATSLAAFDAATGAVVARSVLGPSETFDSGLRGLAWVEDGRALLVGDRRRGGDGYPVHRLERDDACNLALAGDAIFVPQKPISVRAVPRP
jgi:hypothetical protein